MKPITDAFGSMVFNEAVMKEKLPKDVFKKLKATIREGKTLDANVANTVANAMKDWAVEKGVTHYTHWFQPMTGITAEKHESFIAPDDHVFTAVIFAVLSVFIKAVLALQHPKRHFLMVIDHLAFSNPFKCWHG